MDLAGGDASLRQGTPVLDRCMGLGVVVEGTKPLRYQRGLGWPGTRDRATGYAGRSDKLA
jgi:hypothetical protein